MNALERVLTFLQDLRSHLDGAGDTPEPRTLAEFALQRLTPVDLDLCIAIVETELTLWEESGLHVRPALHPYVSERIGVYSLDDGEVGRFLGYPDCCVEYFSEGHVRFDHDSDNVVIVTEGFVPCSPTCRRARRAHLLEPDADPEPYRRLEGTLRTRIEKLGVPTYHSAYRGFYEVHIPGIRGRPP
ncbi:DUF483 domain-containing protein [Methanopyrus sp.]